MSPLKESVWKRLRSRSVNRSSGCIVIDKIYKVHGYGTISVAGRIELLHRVVYWLGSEYIEMKDLPGELQVAHGCKELCCILPEHYSLVTAQENAAHKRKDGTQTSGENHHSAKITHTVAQQIADSWKPQTDPLYTTRKQRAALFGVTIGTVEAIDHRTAWKDIAHPNGKEYQNLQHQNSVYKQKAKIKTKYSNEDIRIIRARLYERSAINNETGCRDFTGRGVSRMCIFNVQRSCGRWAAIVATGVYEDNLLALHNCGRGKSCINPEHLRWGTPWQNMQDKKMDGTTGAKITDEEMLDIAASTMKTSALMELYNIGETTVQQIRKGTYPRLLAITDMSGIDNEQLQMGLPLRNIQFKRRIGTTAVKITDEEMLDIAASTMATSALKQLYNLGASTIQQIRNGTYARLLAMKGEMISE